MNLHPHEIELLTILRLCEPRDEVRIVVEEVRGERKWNVFTKHEEKQVIFHKKNP